VTCVASLPVQPVFVGEGSPGPAVMFGLGKTVLGPVRKILVLSAVSEELNDATPQTAAAVIGKILADASNRSIDAIAFDINTTGTQNRGKHFRNGSDHRVR
jgi:hypothetical protein